MLFIVPERLQIWPCVGLVHMLNIKRTIIQKMHVDVLSANSGWQRF